MSRTAVYTALVLRNRQSGESNSEVTLLTAEEGIIKAILFGGPKSKLRAHSAPFNTGKVWIYRDKSKEYAKLSDFDVHSWRAGLRELYERSITAASVSETILSSHGGGGDWTNALDLAVETLDTLENANEELCALLHIQFLWRWALFLGVQPHLECCIECEQGGDIPLWYNVRESAVLCARCLGGIQESGRKDLLQLNPGCRKWLSVISSLEPAQLHRYSMDKKSFQEAKSLVTTVISESLGKL